MYASMVGVYMVPICIFELVPAENGGEIRVNIAILFLSTSIFTRCLKRNIHITKIRKLKKILVKTWAQKNKICYAANFLKYV